MTAHELLSQLRARGVEVKTSGDDRLVIDAPRGTITEEMRTELSANKAALIQILKDEEVNALPVKPVSAPPPVFTAPAPQTLPVPQAAPAPVAPPAAPTPHIPATLKEPVVDSRAQEIAALQAELGKLRADEAA